MSGEPTILSTWSFGMRGNEAAWPPLDAGGSGLDAVETVCRTVEADPEVDSVGYGGLPDASGRMTLDGAIMRSPAECGSVCALTRSIHPVSVARRVMEDSPHVMLAGPGADEFAERQGFAQDQLLAEPARSKWREWAQQPHVVDQSRDKGYAPPPVHPRPFDRGEGGHLYEGPPTRVEDDDERRWARHDTIGVVALDRAGGPAGACSSSGYAYKLPGRIGDSPIIGHGLYVDPSTGAAVATGAGELIMGVCASFLAMELLRRGATPLESVIEPLQRIIDSFDLRPDHQAALIAMKTDGTWAAAALRPGYKTSLRTAGRMEVLEPDAVLLADT